MPKTITLSALCSVLEQIVDPSCTSPPLAVEGETYDSLAALLLPGGELIAYASFGRTQADVQDERDTANVLAGVVSEAWAREAKERGEEKRAPEPEERDGEQVEEDGGGFSFESELGRIYVCALDYDTPSPNGHSAYAATTPVKSAKTASGTPPRFLLFGICAPESVPVSLLRAKASAVKGYLNDAMTEIGPKAAALKVPGRPAGRTRRVVSGRTASGEVVA
ncbi:hypothetical protein CALVIDRAFT_332695 [Calocera viscosa TUFC12733]|uniref:Uncharacterized protein n=1 Tax=Calocera viscosa (strain TUFC12733) TaxID=1330018 RepID=A0A167HQ57_CALVF|nr:hypothetical protein CALVIDRAFT_332695 [Calocera viscosa TUFC12733]